MHWAGPPQGGQRRVAAGLPLTVLLHDVRLLRVHRRVAGKSLSVVQQQSGSGQVHRAQRRDARRRLRCRRLCTGVRRDGIPDNLRHGTPANSDGTATRGLSTLQLVPALCPRIFAVVLKGWLLAVNLSVADVSVRPPPQGDCHTSNFEGPPMPGWCTEPASEMGAS